MTIITHVVFWSIFYMSILRICGQTFLPDSSRTQGAWHFGGFSFAIQDLVGLCSECCILSGLSESNIMMDCLHLIMT